MTELIVVADDRTGAFETAGACADLGASAVVVPFGDSLPDDGQCVVLDLATRHLSVKSARARAADVHPSAAHKIDSTLRGNWAHELVARQQTSGRPVIVVPSFPAAGRTCEGGIVLVHGTPVADGDAASDVRGPVRSSRPADHLRDAGAGSVAELRPDEAATWLHAPAAAFAVCDARTDADLATVALAWSHHRDVIAAGTAATIAASARSVVALTGSPPAPPRLDLPALIVCGSSHPVALAQVALAAAAGIEVLRADPTDRGDPVQIAAALGAEARVAISTRAFRTIVLVGGDTAASVLGDVAVRVCGTVASGIAWSRPWGDDGPLALTKPGGFGTSTTLVDLLAGVPS
ncbi:MAG TPA: four-carbon acid sugar kinase family protein [Acidimicrobiales bacterium]|nr:four-carbon acid sugar kinase family protein [Acidimicrobiales bacterium]